MQHVLVETENKTTSLTNSTDIYGRVKHKYLPYNLPSETPIGYDSLFAIRLGNGNIAAEPTDRVTSYAYRHKDSQTAERIVYPPSDESRIKSAQLFKTTYELARNLFPEFYPSSSAVLLKCAYMRDERGRETVRYYDDLGHLVGTRSYNGSTQTTHTVEANCYSNSSCSGEGNWDIRTFSLDHATEVDWDCILETSGNYRKGEFSIVRVSTLADTVLKLTEHGNHSGQLFLLAGDYRLIAGAVMLNPNHNVPARVMGSVDFWNPGNLAAHLSTFSDGNVEGQKLAIYPPNYYLAPESSAPEGWILRHTFNTLNLVTSDIPIDAGKTTYLYDAHGNLRFMEDANMREAGKVRFYGYDFLDRLVYIGHATAEFDTLDAATTYSFESESQSLTRINVYDLSPDASEFPFKQYSSSEYQDFDYSNILGKRSAHAYLSSDGWRIEMMGYNETGNVIQKRLLSPDIDATNLRFTYDWQGNPLELHLYTGKRTFSHKFAYDERDRIIKTLSSEGNQAYKQNAFYSYAPEGMRNLMGIGENQNSVLAQIPWHYNLRGWPIEIGVENDDPYRSWQQLSYLPDGQLKNKEFRDYSGEGKKFNYSYDNADRLKKVSFETFENGWQSSNAYRIQNVDYDANGNILSLDRKGQHGEIIDELSYLYGKNNRLHELDELAGASE